MATKKRIVFLFYRTPKTKKRKEGRKGGTKMRYRSNNTQASSFPLLYTGSLFKYFMNFLYFFKKNLYLFKRLKILQNFGRISQKATKLSKWQFLKRLIPSVISGVNWINHDLNLCWAHCTNSWWFAQYIFRLPSYFSSP